MPRQIDSLDGGRGIHIDIDMTAMALNLGLDRNKLRLDDRVLRCGHEYRMRLPVLKSFHLRQPRGHLLAFQSFLELSGHLPHARQAQRALHVHFLIDRKVAPFLQLFPAHELGVQSLLEGTDAAL